MQTPRKNRLIMMFATALLVVVVLTGEAWACPTCKSAISGDDPVSVARATGYFYSILFMMSMPFVIIGTFGGLAYFTIRKAREQQTADSESFPGNAQPTV
jgi:uncharacterized paraquat-inducible protein A